jgi:TonB family protein
MGETAKTAAPAKDVPKQIIDKGPTTVKPRANAVATRIPVAGVTFTKPKAKMRKEPVYPAMLRAQAIEADVEVLVFINAEGKVTSVKILKEAPYPEFNEAAKQAALEQEFEPATRNGEPIPYTLPYTIRFRLTDQ